MKKQEILNTVLSIIARQGLHDSPMAQVAKEANVAAGTIYHYFISKEALLLELYESIRSELQEQVEYDQIEELNYAPEFSSMCLRILKYLIQNPDKFYFLQQYENSPMRAEHKDNESTHTPIAGKFLHFGLISNQLKSMPTELLSALVYNNLAAMARLQLEGEIELNKELIQSVIDGCWNMVKK